MNTLDQILDRVNSRLNPAGLEIQDFEREMGHRDEFGPAEYGNYLATSNDVYTVVNFRARQFGSLRLRSYDSRGNEKLEITEGAEVDLLRKVNPHWTFARLMRQTELAMGVWGETPWAINKTRDGTPAEIYWLRPDRTHPIPHPDKWLSGFIYEPVSGGDPILFDASEVVWFRYPNPLDQYAGLSPLAAARLAADVATASMQANRQMQRQGMSIGGFVVPKQHTNTAKRVAPFSPEQAKDLEKAISRQFTGTKNAHRWGVLRFEADFKSMSVTPKDAEYVDGLNLSFRQVCRAYGVPPPLVFDLEHATLANVSALQKIFWEHTGVPEADFYAYDLEEQLLPMFPRQKVKHLAWDFTKVPALQEATSAVWDRQRQQVEVGALTINEWRKEQGRPSVPWGDVWWAPVNKAPVDSTDGTDTEGDADRSEQADNLNFAALVAAEVADIVGASQGGPNGDGPHY